jgi:uncharacterized protein
LNTDERRREIQNELLNRENPVKGTELSKLFHVSRQVIVQDIAILRAEGFPVIATPNGYMMLKNTSSHLLRKVAVKHSGSESGEELKIMLDYGARILDVIVEHPIYGEIKGNLNIKCKEDLDMFIEKLAKGETEPLSVLTDGIHIHTLEIANEETFQKMLKELKRKDFLA